MWRVKSGEQRAVLKVLRAEPATKPIGARAFFAKPTRSALVKHENVVTLIDAGTTEGDEPFVVMPEVEGETLRARLEREKTRRARSVARASSGRRKRSPPRTMRTSFTAT